MSAVRDSRVWCPDHLTEPMTAAQAAALVARLDTVERKTAANCPHAHEVVPAWGHGKTTVDPYATDDEVTA